MVDLQRRLSVSSRRTQYSVFLAHELHYNTRNSGGDPVLIRFAELASAHATGPLDSAVSAVVRGFAAEHYRDSGAEQFGIDQDGLAEILTGVVSQRDCATDEPGARDFLTSIRLEELVLARACAAGNDRAWEVFLTRYRATLYESAYKIAKEEASARGGLFLSNLVGRFVERGPIAIKENLPRAVISSGAGPSQDQLFQPE